MVRKDLQLFFTDRRAVIMGLVAPIAIASFFGSLFSGGAGGGEPAHIPIAIVDQDNSAISKGILAGAQDDKYVSVTTPAADAARAGVKSGTVTVAVVIPAGFGDAAGRAFFGGGEKPSLTLLVRPVARGRTGSGARRPHRTCDAGGERGDVHRRTGPQTRGRHAAARSTERRWPANSRRCCATCCSRPASSTIGPPAPASGASAQRGITMPYAVAEEAVTSGENVRLQRLRAFVRGHGHPVPPVRVDRPRRRHPARASAWPVEAPAQRADLTTRRCWSARRRADRCWRS